MIIDLQQATARLRNGEVVAVPTETVYGLAASLSLPHAIAQIFSLKGRPENNPLIIHLADPSQVIPFAKSLPAGFDRLVSHFWPGPLTIVIPILPETIPEKARAGLATAAFRVPAHPLACALLTQTGPLVMPSANLSGKPSATQAQHVEADFGPAFPVLDGGACNKGVESTILYYDEKDSRWEIIRQGALSAESFAQILGYTPKIVGKENTATPLCPGQLYRHYAPKAELRLVKTFDPTMQGVVLGYPEHIYPPGCRLIPLGTLSSPGSVAENLYAVLRALDVEKIPAAWVDMNIPENGLWSTIAERLIKAANK